MCLAIPARITEMDENRQGVVDILGVTREASFELTPQAKIGDYVLVHAGFSIEIIDEQSAQETLDIIKEFPELAGLDIPDYADEGAAAAAPQGA